MKKINETMKFLKQLSLFFLVVTSFVFIGCTNEEPDTTGPTIAITNIPDNKEFKFGEDLLMNFEFTDQTGVYEYAYEIYAKNFVPNSFVVNQRLIDLKGYYTKIEQKETVILPAKSQSENYYEGDYIIEVKASDINQRVSTYYKPIRIVYPVTE